MAGRVRDGVLMADWDEEIRGVWKAVNELEGDFREHCGDYKRFSADVTRRQEEDQRDRHGMNLKLDDLKQVVHGMQIKALVMVVGVLASAIGTGVNVALMIFAKH